MGERQNWRIRGSERGCVCVCVRACMLVYEIGLEKEKSTFSMQIHGRASDIFAMLVRCPQKLEHASNLYPG